MNEYAVERLLEVLQSLTNEVQLFREAYVSHNSPKIEVKDEPQKDCNGCKFVGTYDTEFPCANCSRKTKDYYANDEPQTEDEILREQCRAFMGIVEQTERSE